MVRKDKYKVICKYNELFFDENERRRFDIRNSDFWAKMDDLRRAYPNNVITVERRIDNKRAPYLYETIIVHCDSKEVQTIADNILSQYYYIVPLKFCDLDFVVPREDIIKELLRNDQ